MSECTPSDQDIEDTYASTWTGAHNARGREYFRAWLAAHDARVRRDAAREALRRAQKALVPEDSIEWARGARGSRMAYPAIMSTLDSLIEDCDEEEGQ